MADEEFKDNPETPELEPLSDEEVLEDLERKNLLAEIADYKDKYVRLCAEFDNARKRMERERQEFIKYANEGLIAQFLDILDDLERTVKAAEEKHEDYESFLKGIELVMSRLHDMLKKSGVKPMDAKGKMFDPHCHEPLLQEESAKEPEGTVLEEFQKGYYYHDRVVRTAKVKLAKKPVEVQIPQETKEENLK
ncbi:MAG: nucleotide exchange factor GrpE [Candidatus Omnitrophica bacterium]|nr:nucleotide exchange factor GrpE [Candidatus Omnitrophota bacterium]